MKGKIVLITGGNDGIGKHTAIGLARLGAQVIIACRNSEKAANAVAEIRAKTNNDAVSSLPLDLATLDSVRQCAAQFQAQYGYVDVLINNAGLFTSYLQHTTEGFELQFGVNHLGHFLLTQLLLPQLEAAAAPHVINVASHGHYAGAIDFDNLRGEKGAAAYRGLKAYAQSKLANVLFTLEFARRYPHIRCNALHPGGVRTRIANKQGNWLISLGWTVGKLLMISEEAGARTPIYLAADPSAAAFTGLYFDEKQRQRPPAQLAQDEALAKQLWEASLNFVDTHASERHN